jgi:hypothetical protein
MDYCIITKWKFDSSVKFYTDSYFNGQKYYFKPVGEVHITTSAIMMIEKNNFNLNVLAGLCRCAFELKEPPPMIDSQLLNSLETLSNIPRSFNEKYNHFLTLLFKIGGNEYKPKTLVVEEDYPLAFSSDIKDFQRIIDFGIKSNVLECLKSFETEEKGTIIYKDLNFTPEGYRKMNKVVNNYFSFFQPRIDSGNADIDKKINHAYSLFSQDNATIEDKRSACEELAFILEGLKKDVSNFFIDKDISAFFQIVNDFDIRHNKVQTKKLIYEEQVDWIFASLLNTILTYVKLKKRNNLPMI